MDIAPCRKGDGIASVREVTEEGESRRVRATGRCEGRGHERVASSFYRVLVALFLAGGVACDGFRIGTCEYVERDSTSYCRSCNGRRRRLYRSVLHDVHDSINSAVVSRAVDALRFNLGHVVRQDRSLDDGVADVIMYLSGNASLEHEEVRWHVEERRNSARQVHSSS